MRNFSQNVVATFTSYQVNAGEYQNSVRTDDVVRALSQAFETSYSVVNGAFEAVIRNEDMPDYISSSEFEVLKTLYAHIVRVDACERDYWACLPEASLVFFYANLNTGAGVSWVHTVL